MIKFIRQFLPLSLLVLSLMILGAGSVLAQSTAVTNPTANQSTYDGQLTSKCGDKEDGGFRSCTFDLIFGLDNQNKDSVVSRVLNYLVFYLAVPLAVIAIMWAGIQMVIYTGNPGKQEEAKKLLMDAFWGLVLTLSAYLIIKTIVNALADPSVLKVAWDSIIILKYV